MADERGMQRRRQDSGDDGAALGRAHALFAFLDECDVPWAVVGDSSDLGHAVRSDIDIVVAPSQLGRIPALLAAFARTCGARLVQALRHETVACYYVIAWRERDGIGFLHPDVCGDWWRGGRPYIDAATMLEGRVRDPVGFMRPSPGRNAVYYLLKRLSKGALDPARCAYIAGEWNAERACAAALAARALPRQAVEALDRACASGDWGAVLAALPAWQRLVAGGFTAGLGDRAGEAARRCERALRPTGLLVEIGGGFAPADADAFLARWRRAFRRTAVAPVGDTAARWWPALARSTLVLRPTGAVAEPHASWARVRLAVPARDWADRSVDRLVLELLEARIHARLRLDRSIAPPLIELGVP